MKRLRQSLCSTACAMLALASDATVAAPTPNLQLSERDYYVAPGVNWLIFSNWYDGLFADAKISGIELIQREDRIATNGDVRLSATPGQWDPTARLIERKVDPRTGVVTVLLEYPAQNFRYLIRAQPRGLDLIVSVELPSALPSSIVGRAGFNLEFLPPAYFRSSFMADGRAGSFPLHPASGMALSPERSAASGRSDGPGAEPLPLAKGLRLVLAPENAERRVSIESADGEIALYDGRNQAQNGWFVARGLLPGNKIGRVLQWTLRAAAAPGWVRPPVIGHSQLGYIPGEPKIATVELDRNDNRRTPVRLLRIDEDGRETIAAAGSPNTWGNYLRYRYRRFDFSQVREPGLYTLEFGAIRTATFRIAQDLYAEASAPSSDVYLPVAMDHVAVNEAYRVWHGDPHRDDARQAPVNHEHIDLYRQGPTTDTRFAPGEHIPGLAIGGWLDAGDFDIRTQTQYAVIRSLAYTWDQFRPGRDTVSVDQQRRRVELHLPDGEPDILQQIRHGALQLVAQFDSVGHPIHGIVEPDVAQYTHLGDAASKTDGLLFDGTLKRDERRGGRSGEPDDRWAFTSDASALNYGSAAGLAAAARALRGFDDALATRALRIAQEYWRKEQGRAPVTFHHGNTTGGTLASETFAAAVELLLTTGGQTYLEAVARLWPSVDAGFEANALTAVRALPKMPASFRALLRPAVEAWARRTDELTRANPYGVPITIGGWAGNGTVLEFGVTAAALHQSFPELVGPEPVFRAIAYLHGNHPGSDISFVSGVGTRSKEVAYGSNRADFSYIAGGVVPGVVVIKPDFPENKEDWPFLWGENEYVVPEAANYIALMHAAQALATAARLLPSSKSRSLIEPPVNTSVRPSVQ